MKNFDLVLTNKSDGRPLQQTIDRQLKSIDENFDLVLANKPNGRLLQQKSIDS